MLRLVIEGGKVKGREVVFVIFRGADCFDVAVAGQQ